MARMEREQIQSRYILIGSAIVIILVLALIVYGILDQSVLRARQPVAIVNGDRITTKDFQAQTRYGRYVTIQNAMQTYQFLSLFGNDPSMSGQFVSQLQQYQAQLNPNTAAKSVLDTMVDNLLIRQEAQRRGITVSDEDVQAAFQEAFGFFPNGTPTPKPTFEPLPTSTLSALQQTLIPPTATPTLTPTITATVDLTATAVVTITPTPEFTPTPTGPITPTATAAPTATATPYTLEGYQKLYQDTVDNFMKEYNISEADLRYVIESQLYREKVMEAITSDLPRTEEQVWARHILVADDATAQDIHKRLEAGENFCDLAKLYSTDTSNKDNCGDLGWFNRDRMVKEFSDPAFALPPGAISAPITTQFGVHIIQVLGHEERPLTDSQYQQKQQTEFQNWLTEQRDNSDIEVRDYWVDRVVAEPTLPAEVESAIIQFTQAQATPEIPIPTPAP